MSDLNKYKTHEYSTGDPETGAWCTVYELDKALRAIKLRNIHDQDRIKYLEDENKKLKEEKYKDEELTTMKTKLDKMQKEYYRGFPISEEENNRIRSWMNKHDEEVHNAYTLSEKLRLGGCCGGRYSYHFIPTSIGTTGTVKCCSCGAEFTFQEMV